MSATTYPTCFQSADAYYDQLLCRVVWRERAALVSANRLFHAATSELGNLAGVRAGSELTVDGLAEVARRVPSKLAFRPPVEHEKAHYVSEGLAPDLWENFELLDGPSFAAMLGFAYHVGEIVRRAGHGMGWAQPLKKTVRWADYGLPVVFNPNGRKLQFFSPLRICLVALSKSESSGAQFAVHLKSALGYWAHAFVEAHES